MAPLGGIERARTYRCEGLTLRKASIGEADLVVTVFTAERGKVRAVAKGARRSSSRLVGHLEPLTLARLSMAHGRELDIVTQAQVEDGFAALKDDLTSLTRGLYVAELLDGFGPEDSPSPGLLRLAINVLRALPGAAEPEAPLRYFEFHLLRLTGMLPELYQCVECRREVEPDAHRFSVNLGGVLCPGCSPLEAQMRPLSLRAMKVLRLIHRRSLGEVCALSLSPPLAAELKSILSNTVRYWLGKDIRSVAFLERLQGERPGGSGQPRRVSNPDRKEVNMTSKKYETGEVVDLGKAIYKEKIKHLVEPAENGKFVVIDVESSDYEIDEQILPALDRLRERQPHAVTYAGRVGFRTAFNLGGGFRLSND